MSIPESIFGSFWYNMSGLEPGNLNKLHDVRQVGSHWATWLTTLFPHLSLWHKVDAPCAIPSSPCSSLLPCSPPGSPPRDHADIKAPAWRSNHCSLSRTWIFVITSCPRLHFPFLACLVGISPFVCMFHRHSHSACWNELVIGCIPRLRLLALWFLLMRIYLGLKAQYHPWFLPLFHLTSNQTLSC